MAETDLPCKNSTAGRDWIGAELSRYPAARVDEFSGVAGSVDANCEIWQTSDGRRVEVWSDNWTRLSLSGDESLVAELAGRFTRDYRGG